MNCSRQLTHTIREGDTLYRLAKHYGTTVADILSLNQGLNPYNLPIGAAIAVCPGEGYAMPSVPEETPQRGLGPQTALINDMRLAWSQHVYWTRMFLISVAERLKDQADVTARLMRNPKDIANIFAGFYAREIAYTIEQLLTEHLQIGGNLITALRDGKTAETADLTRRWYINADQMADAFSGINPYYVYEDLRAMLHTHLDLTTEEVAARLAGRYPADIEAFDRVEEASMAMADYFSYGVMRHTNH